MGFFAVKARDKRPPTSRLVSVETLHKAECNACPLNDQKGLKHPHMEATGSERPVVYMLGEAPGATEDARGKQFVGASGRFLRSRIPADWLEHLRWNNCVRCRPPGNRTPVFVELECCRPSVIKDIEAARPRAIFGFGNVPLNWALSQSGITNWRGRFAPVQIGDHACWYFPMFHPSYISRMGGREAKGITFVFELDLKRAFDMVEDMPESVVHTKEYARKDVEYVTGGHSSDLETLLKFIEEMYAEEVVGFDYETNGLRPYGTDAKILTVALSGRHGTMAFPLRHPDAKWSGDELERIEDALRAWLYKSPCRKAVHHLAFELEWSAFFYGKGVVWGRWEDTLSQAFILDERQGCLSLEFLGIQYFGINLKVLSDLDRKHLERAKLEDVLVYNGIDAKYHRLLYLKQAARLKAEGLHATYREHLRRVPTMVLTQLKGLPVSQRIVDGLYRRYTKRLEGVEGAVADEPAARKFKRRFGKPFRPSSNVDVKKAVTSIIGKRIDSVDEASLKGVRHALTKLVLQWRKINKVLSTYVAPMREGSPYVYPDGKIHPVISTTRTRTQRTASEGPNIQNWPNRDGGQKEVRKQIRPRPGPRGERKIVSFDYGQIQARNVAMESKDKVLVQAFWDEYDIHTAWAERIAQLHPKWVEKGMRAFVHDKKYHKTKRNEAKNEFVFPSFFGAQASSVSNYLTIPIEIAEQLHDEFWDQFPDVKKWHNHLIGLYHRKGYVTGLTGFRRRAPISPNQLINSPIQSDEAAIVCDAMTRLARAGEQAAMEIHDDLTFIWYESEIEKRAEAVIDAMLDCPFKWARIVPIVVEMAVGDDWYSLKDVGAYSSATWRGDLRTDKADVKLIGTWDEGTGWSDSTERRAKR